MLLKIAVGTGAFLLADAAPTFAQAFTQISGDGSLGSLVNGLETAPCLGPVCTLTGGTLNTAGSTLLHSFQEFSLADSQQSALFVDPGVNDIVVRVTGGDRTLINGTLGISLEAGTGAGSEANLFFINPGGISFGPTAQLDLGGAFVASTASQLDFGNGQVLSTGKATPVGESLLNISAPIGLGFLAETPSESITVQGTGHLLAFGSPSTPASAFVNRVFQQATLPLAVRTGEKIALIGNRVELVGGSLSALAGQIEIGSVAAGTVELNQDALSSSFSGALSGPFSGYSQVQQFADIALTGRSVLDVSDRTPGQITLRGQNISVAGSSAVLAETLLNDASPSPLTPPSGLPSDLPSGLIAVAAEDAVSVSGFSLDAARPPFHSYLSVDVAPDAIGDGGTVAVQAQNLRVDDGGQIGASTFGLGDAGQLQIDAAETLLLSGRSVLGPSGLFAISDVLSSGNAGELVLLAEHLVMDEGAQAITTSLGTGAAGSITIDANRVSLVGTSQPLMIPSSGPGPGPGPGLAPAPPVVIDDAPPLLVTPTLLQSGMGPAASGQGGGITIDASQVQVTDGAEISTGTFGTGHAGALSIVSKEVTVAGFSPSEGPSGIFTTVNFGAAGRGGALSIESDRLQILDGAQIATSTAGSGTAGDLIIQGGTVLASGRTAQGRSGLFATAIGSTGAGGNLRVDAETVVVESGATLSVSNFASGENSPIPPGQGAAGDLQVRAADIMLRDRGSLSADTAAGDRGNIRIDTNLLALREGSGITTNATNAATGGNIDIETTGFVVAVPAENSDITANSVFGDGGQVTIAAQSILGFAARPSLTAESDITASSEFGVAGETRLETVDSEVRPTTETLPQSTEVAEVVQGCVPKGDRAGRFVQSGRGGISTNPYGVLNSRDSLADVSIPGSLAIEAETAINEAREWQRNERGEVVLLAAVPNEQNARCLSWQS